MNENIDLTKILKNCPYRTKLYSVIHGEVEFMRIDKNNIIVRTATNMLIQFTSSGKQLWNYEDYSECILFPSKEQRDWNKFIASWYKKYTFDPSTLKPFDKVLVKTADNWSIDFFSYYDDVFRKCICTGLISYIYCIPYNDETKDLVGTCDEAPGYYKWW